MSSTSTNNVPDSSESLQNNNKCDFCSLADCYIGINEIKIPESTANNYEPKFKKNDRKNDNDYILGRVQKGSKVQFKMGNGKYTEDIEEAKDYLMKRTYPEIENGTQTVPFSIPETSLPEKYFRGVLDVEKFQEKNKQFVDCDFCSLPDCFIGINDLEIPESGWTKAKYEPKIKKNDRKNDNKYILCRIQQRSKVQFKMGNGKYTEDIEEAKDHLMFDGKELS